MEVAYTGRGAPLDPPLALLSNDKTPSLCIISKVWFYLIFKHDFFLFSHEQKTQEVYV